jgi:hypothetical protein
LNEGGLQKTCLMLRRPAKLVAPDQAFALRIAAALDPNSVDQGRPQLGERRAAFRGLGEEMNVSNVGGARRFNPLQMGRETSLGLRNCGIGANSFVATFSAQGRRPAKFAEVLNVAFRDVGNAAPPYEGHSALDLASED